MTSISIAHRLSTIEDADKIILMKDGKIIEEGTYINLIELRGQFFKLSVGKWFLNNINNNHCSSKELDKAQTYLLFFKFAASKLNLRF